jgi:hypothetical protein
MPDVARRRDADGCERELARRFGEALRISSLADGLTINGCDVSECGARRCE